MDTDDGRLARALKARLEAESGQPVPLIETHISWVLLAGNRAYKLKKAVRLPFLDFSTRAARQHFCEEELRLNRRFAPELYLSVLPVTGTVQALCIGGEGEPLDHVVCMRRFPASALLLDRVRRRQVDGPQVLALARRVAAFHDNAPRVAGAHAARRAVSQAAEVIDRLATSAGAVWHFAARQWAGKALWRLRRTLGERERNGGVREVHGDLHLGNIAFIDGEALPFDCIEFDPALRCIDVMSDLAFLTMDLRANGRPDLAFRLLNEYLQVRGDFGGLAVLRFFEVYRALVRASVARLRGDSGDAARYLRVAARLQEGQKDGAASLGLLILCGVSGSGKSSLAAPLAANAGAVCLRSDVERKRLFGLRAEESSRARGLQIYDAQTSDRTYARLLALARTALHAGFPVVVDAVNQRTVGRARFEALAASLDVPWLLLQCTARPETLRTRVVQRAATGGDASEADLRVLEAQLASWESFTPQEMRNMLAVDTDLRVDADGLAARWLAQRQLGGRGPERS
jgi:aminoglycoside phosphotransferase family enzyme/predicted kinase